MQNPDKPATKLIRSIKENPSFPEMFEGLRSILPDGSWWITDTDFNRYSLPFNAQPTAQCIANHEDAIEFHYLAQSQSQESTFDKINAKHIIGPNSEGFVQGFTGVSRYDLFGGGIGVTHIPENKKLLLESVLKILVSYLSLFMETMEDHDDLELVQRIWSETISVIDLEELLQRIMEELCSTLELDSGLILLINEDGEFHPAKEKGLGPALLKKRNVDVSRYDYLEYSPNPKATVYQLNNKDPLRLWFFKSLNEEQIKNPGKDDLCMAVPFYRGTYLIGLFLFLPTSFQEISDKKKYIIKLLATGGAVAIDNALTLERMNQRRRALSTIHVVHRLISSSITFRDLLPKIGQLTRQLLKVKKCAIFLLHSTKQQLIPEVTLGLEKNEIGHKPLNIGEGLPGWVASEFNPVIYHPRNQSKPPWRDSGEQYPSEAYMAVALFDADIEGVIMVAEKDEDFTPGDREILSTFAEQAVIAMRNTRIHEGERTVTVKALRSIANLIETHDPTRPGITATTCHWTQRLCYQMNLNEKETRHTTYAALLHDTGMLRAFQTEIPSDEQRLKGPQLSLRFVQSLGLHHEVGRIVYHANEAWNGTGYPDGLKGSEIPLGSRIIAVAYTYATLFHRCTIRGTSERVANQRTIRVLTRLAGRAFDPDVVNSLEQIIHNPPTDDEYFI